MKLFIVESPGKIKKIQSFLGSDYKVTASVGHIRQLKKSDYFDEKTFSPKYDIIDDKPLNLILNKEIIQYRPIDN